MDKPLQFEPRFRIELPGAAAPPAAKSARRNASRPRVRQPDVARALKAAAAAGLVVDSYEIDDEGRINVKIRTGDEPDRSSGAELDEWMSKSASTS